MVFPRTWESIYPLKTALSKGELYTIITNKKAKGKKGAIVIMAGTKVEPIIEQLLKKEITLDMANSMHNIAILIA